jgi:hypothetical protein
LPPIRVGADLADQHDKSAKACPYSDLDAIGDTRQDQQRRSKVSNGKPEKVTTPRVLTASSVPDRRSPPGAGSRVVTFADATMITAGLTAVPGLRVSSRGCPEGAPL